MIYIMLGLVWALIVGVGSAFSFRNFSAPIIGVFSFVAFLLGTAIAYMATPSIGFFYIGFWFYVLLPIVFVFFVSALSDKDVVSGLPAVAIAVGFVAFLGLAFVTTSEFMNSDRYYQLLTVNTEKEFDPQKVFLDQSQARFVDQSLASRSANEILGKERGMASRYNVDTMRIQNINGELRWLSPLKHASFTRWIDDSTAPGYVSVSVNEYSDSKMNVDDVEINYGTNGFYFSSDVERHVYQNGFSTVIVDDYTMEVDDSGKPYWVGSILEPKVGFSGHVVTGIVVVDAKTGEIDQYSVEDAPAWVDRIQPEDVVRDLTTYWGKYANSWWDGFVGNNVVVPTYGSSLVFSKEGNSSWYTGMQSSSGNKESSMGFMLIDSRTGVASFYQRSGITETVALQSIEGRVQEAEYSSSYPVPYYIGGTTTFLSILKDKRGNVQGVGLVSYDNRSTVVYGENFNIALRRYMSALSSNGNTQLAEDVEMLVISGTVDRSYVQSVDSRLVLNFTLEGEEYKGIFFLTSADSNKSAMLTRDGDNVQFEVYDIEGTEVQASEFTNTTLVQ